MQADKNERDTFNTLHAAVLREQDAIGEVEIDSFTVLSAGDHPPSVTRNIRTARGVTSLTVRLAGDEMTSTIRTGNGKPTHAHAAGDVRPDFRSLLDSARDASLVD